MLLKSFKNIVGELDTFTNSYIVYDENSKEGIVIDLADNADKLYNYIENLQINLKYIVLTHCHADHTAGLKGMKKYYPNVKVLIHEYDNHGLTDDAINMCSYIMTEPNFVSADIVLKDGDEIKFGNLVAKVIHTPGHTAGSISLLIDDALFSGDTMFKGTYGRTDLPTGNDFDMQKSLRKLLKLDDEIIVYPGHGATTMICDEK